MINDARHASKLQKRVNELEKDGAVSFFKLLRGLECMDFHLFEVIFDEEAYCYWGKYQRNKMSFFLHLDNDNMDLVYKAISR